MKLKPAFLAWGVSAIALCTLALSPAANAAIISGTPNAGFDNGTYTLTLAGGAASYTFSDTNDFFNPVAVTTGGTATIASLGAPFYDPPRPTSYFTDDRAPYVDGTLLAQFLGYTSPATVPFSISDSYLALRFMLGDGFHYGYARIAGTYVSEFGYETEADVGIQAGTMMAAVPEPANIALLGLGLFVIGGLVIGRRKETQALAPLPA